MRDRRDGRTRADLACNKRAAGRPRDLADAAAIEDTGSLIAVLQLTDERLVWSVLDAMAASGIAAEALPVDRVAPDRLPLRFRLEP